MILKFLIITEIKKVITNQNSEKIIQKKGENWEYKIQKIPKNELMAKTVRDSPSHIILETKINGKSKKYFLKAHLRTLPIHYGINGVSEIKAIEILKSIQNAYDLCGIDLNNVEEAIKELEELKTKDRLAELEKVILDYYLAEGYKFDLFGSRFQINISTFQNQKEIQIMIKKDFNSNYETVFRVFHNTTKEMFDAAFEHFSIKE